MPDGTTVPVDRKQLLALMERDPKCVHCGKRLLKIRSSKHPEPEIEVDRNALSELIAWCTCRNCWKVSPLMLK